MHDIVSQDGNILIFFFQEGFLASNGTKRVKCTGHIEFFLAVVFFFLQRKSVLNRRQGGGRLLVT